jgi:hypothetical protein
MKRKLRRREFGMTNIDGEALLVGDPHKIGLYLQCKKISQARNQHKAGSKRTCFHASLTLRPGSQRQYISPKFCLASTGLFNVIP